MLTFTILIHAIVLFKVRILERFAERVDVNAVNQDGDTVPHVACSQGKGNLIDKTK